MSTRAEVDIAIANLKAREDDERVTVMLNSVRAALPARLRVVAHRVTACPVAAERGSLRVLLDGQLVSEWGYSQALRKWTRWESAAYMSADAKSVERAIARVCKS